jgi:hypothetical protein
MKGLLGKEGKTLLLKGAIAIPRIVFVPAPV